MYFSSGRIIPLRTEDELKTMAKVIFPVSIDKLKINPTPHLPINISKQYQRNKGICLWDKITEFELEYLRHKQLDCMYYMHCGCLKCITSVQSAYLFKQFKAYGKYSQYFKNPKDTHVIHSHDSSQFIFIESGGGNNTYRYDDTYEDDEYDKDHSDGTRFIADY